MTKLKYIKNKERLIIKHRNIIYLGIFNILLSIAIFFIPFTILLVGMGNYGGSSGGYIMDIAVLCIYTLTLVALIAHARLLIHNNHSKTAIFGSISCIIANVLPTLLSFAIYSQFLMLDNLFNILSITSIVYLVLTVIGVTLELWSLKIKKI
ncbi:hypothetical protein [Apilactobacillus xinyiensis]|uniref:hypothetical protein n=1 Tax=Apilactobacillus xinyiensis TaxID=2841032 RepID=UPI00200F6E1E|nr:hypothetical protein [Apilactobacillus xinyiensis]MCL0329800.1 hypothetical protein [Apilactobacillus xinyiensis]